MTQGKLYIVGIATEEIRGGASLVTTVLNGKVGSVYRTIKKNFWLMMDSGVVVRKGLSFVTISLFGRTIRPPR